MRTKRKYVLQFVALFAALALVLAACGGDDDDSTNASNGPGETSSANQKKGGNLIVGAEQWPECLNPITQCANSSWLQWTVPIHVLPRLAELNEKNEFVASPLVTEMPTLDNGGLKQDPFTVTWHLNKDAKWDDGSPITCDDVAFTEDAYLKSTGSLSTVGYDSVTKVNCPDPQTVEIQFKTVYADWADVFGGFSGVILQKSKFPNGPNTAKEMQKSYGFSGGPWILKSYSKNQIVLTANKNYWDADRVPLLDQVTFVPRTDTNTEVQALKSGEVAAIYPQPTSSNVPQLKGSNIKTAFGTTTQYESLWFNQKEGRPFADENVRAAFMYSFDRDKFLNDIVKPFSPDAKVLNCSNWSPDIGDWCDNTQFADIKYDPDKAADFMAKSGYEKDSNGIWAKDGQELKLKWSVTTGNQRRADTQTEFIPLLKKEGWSIATDNSDPDTLFQQRLPAGDYDFAMFIQVTSPDPSVASILAADQIPGPENDGKGQNQWWWNNAEATKIIHEADTELDPAKRADMVHQIGQFVRDDYVTLPLYIFPAMSAWRSDKVEGPIDAFINSPESNFWNLWDWSLK